jgi:FkbM family methyltransferase
LTSTTVGTHVLQFVETKVRGALSSLPNIRGRQRLFRAIDGVCGARPLLARHEVMLQGFLSSPQDLTFARASESNPVLAERIAGLPRGGVFIDCGANIGYFSALAARQVGEGGLVLSLEPSPREFQRLSWAVAHNPHSCQWRTLNLAAGDAEGQIAINDHAGHTGMNRVSDSGRACLVRTLDAVAADEIPAPRLIDLIKIDVEGYELRVLRGMDGLFAARRVKTVVAEITDAFLQQFGDSKEALYAYLQSHGFRPTCPCDEWQYDECFELAE